MSTIAASPEESAIYIGGKRIVNGDKLALVLRWDGVAVKEVATGHGTFDHGWVSALAVAPDDKALYAGGQFFDFAGVPILNFAKGACAPCRADCDASGSLDFFDFLCFANAFNEGC